MALSTEHATWLEARGISCETAAAAGVTSSKNNIVFDFQTFQKFRSVKEKRFWMEPAGAELRMWNEAKAAEQSEPGAPLIITEGEIDALSFMTAGFANVVSVPNGASLDRPGEGEIVPHTDGAFRYLWEAGRMKPWIRSYKKIVLATDGDDRGRVLADELAIRLGRNLCWIVTYPPGCKDGNDVLNRLGPVALTELVRNAKPLVANRLTQFSNIPIPSRTEQYSTGWKRLDKHLIICPPELIIVTGAPNAGKSQWTLALCANLARVHGLKGAIFQFEDNVERNRCDLLKYAKAWQFASDGGKPVGKPPKEWIDDMFVTISPSEDKDEDVDFDLRWLRDSIEEAACRHGCRWVLIDPWNEVEHCWRANENETTYINNALRELKRMARRYRMAIFVVTHPTKGIQDKPLELMSLYDCAGSAAWANKCDHGLIIHRDKPGDLTTHVKIAKSKDFSRMGVPGTVDMEFIPGQSYFR